MSFDPAWLALREPYDHAARSHDLARRFAAALPARAHVLDLAGGLGSGARFLAPFLGTGARLTVVDHDPRLLEGAAARGHATLAHDLRDGLPAAADGWHTQALLDLVSHDWLEAFAASVVASARPLLATLTVDGRVVWSPEDPDDADVQTAFRDHQRLDRGFGPSPGPQAGAQLAARLREAGWAVTVVEADWQVPSTDRAMIEAMLQGTHEAARACHAEPEAVDAWLARRRQDPLPSLRVGHVDLLALPPTARGG